MRDINDILFFRQDISPFLVHLCRKLEDRSAGDSLRSIIQQRRLHSRTGPISDARFGTYTNTMDEEEKLRFFGAVCLTETPINEIHCLLDIADRRVQLEPYGLVFQKETLVRRGVSPVVYLNNENGDKNEVVAALCTLIRTKPDAAAEFLPLISVFGRKLQSPFSRVAQKGRVDFRWEREWRYPNARGALEFDEQDVLVGLCPHDEIRRFEHLFPRIGFIDPTRNVKWYATKLIEARQRLELKYSVV
jgi:hypothetical protein